MKKYLLYTISPPLLSFIAVYLLGFTDTNISAMGLAALFTSFIATSTIWFFRYPTDSYTHQIHILMVRAGVRLLGGILFALPMMVGAPFLSTGDDAVFISILVISALWMMSWGITILSIRQPVFSPTPFKKFVLFIYRTSRELNRRLISDF